MIDSPLEVLGTLVGLGVWVVLVRYAGRLALRRNRSARIWMWLTAVSGLSLLVLALLPLAQTRSPVAEPFALWTGKRFGVALVGVASAFAAAQVGIPLPVIMIIVAVSWVAHPW